MSGLAAELRGARDWMKVATAWLVGVSGIRPYTWRMEEQTGMPYVIVICLHPSEKLGKHRLCI